MPVGEREDAVPLRRAYDDAVASDGREEPGRSRPSPAALSSGWTTHYGGMMWDSSCFVGLCALSAVLQT
jgi:hypothetical protein